MSYFGRKAQRIFGCPYSTDLLSTEVKTSCTYANPTQEEYFIISSNEEKK